MATNSTVPPITYASQFVPNPPALSAPTPQYFYYPAYTYQNGSFQMVPNYFMPPPPIYNFPHTWPMPQNPYLPTQQVQGTFINSQINKPEELKYQCRSCDRGYRTEFKYNEHIAQHVKCPADNCNYSAIESLVEFHYKWQHVTGLASKCWGNTPEEIEEWRINRRRNFPTEIKILKKKEQKAKLAQKYAASRVIYEKKAQLNNDTSQFLNNCFPRNNNQYSNSKSANNFNNKDFKATSKFQASLNETWKDNSENLASSSINGPNNNNSFNPNTIIRKYRQRSLKYLVRAVNNKLPLGTETSQWRRKYTLLERLLAPEIKAEREMILKCVKYVAKNILPNLTSNQNTAEN